MQWVHGQVVTECNECEQVWHALSYIQWCVTDGTGRALCVALVCVSSACTLYNKLSPPIAECLISGKVGKENARFLAQDALTAPCYSCVRRRPLVPQWVEEDRHLYTCVCVCAQQRAAATESHRPLSRYSPVNELCATLARSHFRELPAPPAASHGHEWIAPRGQN